MAIKNLFARGVGYANGQIAWLVTRGFGAYASSGTDLLTGVGGFGRFDRLGRRRGRRHG